MKSCERKQMKTTCIHLQNMVKVIYFNYRMRFGEINSVWSVTKLTNDNIKLIKVKWLIVNILNTFNNINKY